MPKTKGRLGRGTVIEMITKAPEKIPATPIPAMARPTIKAVLVGATPQIKEPTSKRVMATKKAHLT